MTALYIIWKKEKTYYVISIFFVDGLATVASAALQNLFAIEKLCSLPVARTVD